MCNTNLAYRLLITISCLLLSQQIGAQCQPPTLVQVSDSGADFLDISWFYFDTTTGWELELVPFGESPTLEPTTGIITEKHYQFEDLDPASAYTIFIRTVCDTNIRSDWNPVFTRTNIPQPSPCLFTLPISNDNCNTGLQSFKIEIENTPGNLGDDLFLSSVDIILQHTWPADLDIRLLSPSGKEVLLSQNNGTVTDNYGDVLDTNCSGYTRFSDLACTNITDEHPPFIGAFTPESPLFEVEDGTPANGIWTLQMCDRSTQDIGTLKFINLNFEPLVCEIPRNILVKSINATEVEVVWSSFAGCELTEINLNLNGSEIRTTSVPCLQETIVIDDLMPGTEYEIFVLSNCLSDLTSPLSCPFKFTTACTEVTEEESFDFLALCTPGCAFDCTLQGNWSNSQSADDQDWISWNAPTDTDGTGPRNGVFGGGAYLYLEASPDICPANANAILTSDCIAVSANEEGCDLSFWYYLHGTDIGSLSLMAIANAASEVDTLLTLTGEQGDLWQQYVVDLSMYDDQALVFRFVGETRGGTQGDIAIDQIEFRGSTFTPGGFTYYQDLDQDGFGNISFPITICSTSPSAVFAANALDCNDEDPLINPNADEINCNGIDENCSGNEDDSPIENTITATSIIVDELCSTPLSGSIELVIVEGQGPFTYRWDTGDSTSSIVNIAAGLYSCTISDASTCRTEVGPIEVLQISNIATSIQIQTSPSCLGRSDGVLVGDAANGVAPYTYEWSDGSSGDSLMEAAAGAYFVIATDRDGCKSDTTRIELEASGAIEADVSFRLPIRCYGAANGLLRVDAITGVPPFTYRWNTEQTDAEISGLAAGFYQCTITDATGCRAIVETEMLQPDSLVGLVVSQENVDCFGGQTGSIKTTVLGGVAPYSYAWNITKNTDDIFDLPAGQYQLTITDANACTALSDTVTISEPDLLSAMVDSAIVTSCILSEDGYISVATTGGISPYNYFWSIAEVDTSALSNIQAGTYNVTITDDNNCKTTVSNYELESNALPISVQMDIVTQNNCADDSLATIIATISDATTPVDYNWSVGRQISSLKSADTLIMLPAGSYMVTITDADGCIGIGESTVIDSIPPIVFSIIEKTDNICFDDTVGMISIAPSGGNPPYSYLWSTGDTTLAIDNLSTGRYQLTITDDSECTETTQNISINSLPPFEIEVVATPTLATEPTGTIKIEVTGGHPPYSYLWADDLALPTENEVAGLDVGLYTVTLTDQSGCDSIILIDIELVSNTSEQEFLTHRIYPNPATDLLYIEINEAGSAEIEISTLQGRSLLQIHTTNERSTLNMMHLPSGIYILSISTSTGTTSQLVSKI